jgi:hypothetical protein
LSHAPSFFRFSYFSDGVLYFCLDGDPPTYASHIAGITGMGHHTQLVPFLWGGLNSGPGGLARHALCYLSHEPSPSLFLEIESA